MSTLEHAIALAARAHAGQVDKAGEPYVLHLLRVMLAMRTTEERIVAVLHDLVEDTDTTLEQVRAQGFSAAVVAAIDVLTKRPGETRLEAALRAVAHPLARSVKLADNADNLDRSRLPHPTARDEARLQEYRAVRAVLLAGPAGAVAR